MNKKGFTLVELIAIILILLLIALVSFPSIKNMMRTEEEKKYENMIENLCLAGESYIYSNIDIYKQNIIPNNKIEIFIEDLMNYGNVEKKLINPKTNKSVKKDILIYLVLDDKSLSCEYKEV